MKKRKGSLLQRTLAVFLSAVLVAGMAWDAASASVLAQESVSRNAVETVEEPQSVMMAAEPAPQANNIASGDGWVLDADGKLTISSDEGMAGWENYMRGDYIYYTQQVVKVEIQDGVTSLGNNAFFNYGELTGITIADSVTSIAGSAFCGCWKLRKITIPNNVTSISDHMFMNSGLEEITIPGSVTSIGEFAFWGCGLTKITIPASVKSIGEKAFIYCDNLNEVIIKSETPPTLGDGVFTDCGFVKDNTQSIYVPEGKAQAYKTAWTDWAAYIADGTATAGEHKHNNVTFTAWTEEYSLPDTAGNYYLTKGVTLSGTWKVPNGETNLCLNGKTIRTSGDYYVIEIPRSCTLNLYDCQNAGNITGGQKGGVFNNNTGTFYMYGGKISGNGGKEYYDGGVRNTGTFFMYGGEISGNTANSSVCSGVHTYGAFYMYGGKIINNNNSVDSGEYGGGVFINGGGSFTVGGDAVISGNTFNEKGNNVFLGDKDTIMIDSNNPLSDSAYIGVTTETAPTAGSPVNITGHNKGDYSKYFHSDNPAYEIVNANDVLQLTVKEKTHTHDLTLTPAKDATCMKDGNSAYYVCGGNDGCGKWFSDAEGTQEITNHDSVLVSKTGHSYDESAWGYTGADGHAHKCRNCDAHDTALAHTPGAAATATMPQTCMECGYIIAPATGTASGSGSAPATGGSHTHVYGEWQHDSTRHWKECSCKEETGRAVHDWGGWITDKEATAAEEGTKHRDCQTCGYRQTETIPTAGTDPGSGTVTPEVKPGANVPVTNISTPTEELKDMLLTDEEKRQVQNGTNVKIVLEVQDAGNTVSASDKETVAQALNGYTEGQYLNIDLYKLVGANRTDITETKKKIKIVLTVPDSLKNTDGKETRTFALIRLHDGRAKLLNDLDSSADTITIKTDRFSTYAVVYKDSPGGGNSGKDDKHEGDGSNGGGNGGKDKNNDGSDKNNNDSGNNNSNSGNNSGNNNGSNNNNNNGNDKNSGAGKKDDEPETGDVSPLEIYATLSMIAGLSYLRLYFTERKRGMTEETKKELVSRIVGWAKRGGRIRRYLAIAAVFVLLVYYHSIGKRTCGEWKEIYGE